MDVSFSLCEVTAICEEITGNHIEIGSEPRNRPADVRIYLTDHSRRQTPHGLEAIPEGKNIVADICAWIHAKQALIKDIRLLGLWSLVLRHFSAFAGQLPRAC